MTTGCCSTGSVSSSYVPPSTSVVKPKSGIVELMKKIFGRYSCPEAEHMKPCTQELRRLFNPDTHTGRIFEREGTRGVLRYLNTNQPFEVITENLTFVGLIGKDFPLFGRLGHHAMIVLPGQRICDWDLEKDKEYDKIEVSQRESRVAKGRDLEAMAESHATLLPQYEKIGFFSDTGLIHYRFFRNDCFTYVDRLLTEHGQARTTLKRAPENEEQLRCLVSTVSNTFRTCRDMCLLGVDEVLKRKMGSALAKDE